MYIIYITNNKELFMKNFTFILLTIISMVFIGCTTNSTNASYEEIDSSSSIDTVYTYYKVDSCRMATNSDYDDQLVSNVMRPNDEITYDEIKWDMDNFDSTKITTNAFNMTFSPGIEIDENNNVEKNNTLTTYNIQDSINISNVLSDNGNKSINTWKFLDENHILYYSGRFENHKYKYYFYIIYLSKT